MGEKATTTAEEGTVRATIDAFLEVPRAAATARAYRRTLDQLAKALGPDRPLDEVDSAELAATVQRLWGEQAPRTWNRQIATVGSWLNWCRANGRPADHLTLRADRRAAPDATPSVVDLAELERQWSRPDVPLRERALWRLCYSAAASAQDALALDVEDLDLVARRARTPNGRALYLQPGAAALLGELVDGRTTGPVFLASRRPTPGRGPREDADLDPDTGRARLSYERAEQLCKHYTGVLTLGRLRQARLDHLLDAGVHPAVLLALSGRQRLVLEQADSPGDDAVAEVLAGLDRRPPSG